jgi:hypothetical protein
MITDTVVRDYDCRGEYFVAGSHAAKAAARPPHSKKGGFRAVGELGIYLAAALRRRCEATRRIWP